MALNTQGGLRISNFQRSPTINHSQTRQPVRTTAAPAPAQQNIQWSQGYMADPYYSNPANSGFVEVYQPGQVPDTLGRLEQVDRIPYPEPQAEDPGVVAARVAEQNRIAGVRNRATTSAENYYAGSGRQLDNFGNTYGQTTRDWADQYGDNVNEWNTNSANNQLNLRRGMASVAGGIRQAVRSGGVQLANMNALDSGAADALARAFARQGRQQVNSLNNDAQLEQNRLDTSRGIMTREKDQKIGDFRTWRDTTVGDIGETLRQSLSALDADVAAEGVTGAVDMGRRNVLVDGAVNTLNQIDAQLQQRLSGINFFDQNQAAARAAEMDAAGLEGVNPFNVDFNNSIVAGNGRGAPISQLPIYTRRRES